MATTESAGAVNGNGNYGNQSYDNFTASTSAANSAPSYGATQEPAASSSASAAEVPKDEVGWYFVEQYYTTLSKSPEKLYVGPSAPQPAFAGKHKVGD